MKITYDVLACPSTYREFVQTHTKRSHVTKLDGCEKCHRLQFESDLLTPTEKTEFLEHQILAENQETFKQIVLKAIGDGAIKNGVAIPMDFSKFDIPPSVNLWNVILWCCGLGEG